MGGMCVRAVSRQGSRERDAVQGCHEQGEPVAEEGEPVADNCGVREIDR